MVIFNSYVKLPEGIAFVSQNLGSFIPIFDETPGISWDFPRVAGGSGGASSDGTTPYATLRSQVVVGSSTEKPREGCRK